MLKTALRRVCVPFLAIAVALVLLALSSGSSEAGLGSPDFQPEFNFLLCNNLKATFSGPAGIPGTQPCTPITTPGGTPDITVPFVVPTGSMNYDQFHWISLGGAGETRAAGPAAAGPNVDGTGTPGGGLESTTTLGLLTNPCSNTILPDFIWWEAETNWDDSIACAGEGTSDRWNNMAADGGDAFPGQADANSPIVTKFPTCSAGLFDPDGSGSGPSAAVPDGSAYDPVTPNWRGAGLTQVPPGGDWQMLQNFEFDAGDLGAAFRANPGTTNHPYAKLTDAMGYANVVILNDPTTVILQPNPISDFCSVLGVNGMIKGVVGGVNRIVQPGTAGSYFAQARTQSYRDTDNDGLENGFDTCVWAANTDDPYVTNGADADMLDPACDPGPNTLNADQDGDGYVNSQDYCPLVANPLPGGETDSENTVSYNAGAPDGGPRQDQIGDSCDSENGGSDTVSDGPFFLAIHQDSVCLTGGGTVDGDGDGWCNDIDPNDGDVNDPGHAGAFHPGQWNHFKIDAAGAPGVDSDGDSFSNLDEWYMGCDPGMFCAAFTAHDAWPPDMDNNRTANLVDLLQFKPAFNCAQGQACYKARVDLDTNGTVNLVDLLKFKPVFNVSCTFGPPYP